VTSRLDGNGSRAGLARLPDHATAAREHEIAARDQRIAEAGQPARLLELAADDRRVGQPSGHRGEQVFGMGRQHSQQRQRGARVQHLAAPHDGTPSFSSSTGGQT